MSEAWCLPLLTTQVPPLDDPVNERMKRNLKKAGF